MVVFDKIANLQDTDQNPIVSDKAPPVKGIGETKNHRLVLEDLEIKTKPGLSLHRTACLDGHGSTELHTLKNAP
jgi:hypothetical protein